MTPFSGAKKFFRYVAFSTEQKSPLCYNFPRIKNICYKQTGGRTDDQKYLRKSAEAGEDRDNGA